MLQGRRRPLAVLVGTLHLCTACYQYVPVRTAAVGSRVALEINDDGRVALRDQLGPGIVRLEGRVSAVEGQAFLVQTFNVTQIRGGQALPIDSVVVRLSEQYVERIDERRLSRTRTWMFIGGAVAIVATFLLSGGFGGRASPDQPGGPPVDEYRGLPYRGH